MAMVDATPTKLETFKIDNLSESGPEAASLSSPSPRGLNVRAADPSAANQGYLMRRATDAPGKQAAQPDSDIPSRYQLLTVIGVGGMGIVYKVYDRDTGEVIALKILKPEIADDEDMRENLRQEVCVARKVTHKNVCRIHEFNRSAAAACISMELVEGESLAAKLHREGSLAGNQAVDFARQVCAGLGEAHAQGIVHRDLKPANIMVSSAGIVKIMDFGIARLAQGATQMTRTMVGTPEYMAPEQVELKGVTPGTDIYSLGLVLYEMVTGQRAFSGESAIGVAVRQIREMPKRPVEINAAIDARLDAAIMKCLRKEPARRFQTINELDAALTEIQKLAPDAAPRAQKVKKLKAGLQPAIERGFEAAKAAASHAGSFALHAGAMIDQRARRATAGLSRTPAPAIAKSVAQTRANSRTWLTPVRIRAAKVAAVVGVTFFTTAVTFGLVTRKGVHANAASPASRVAPLMSFAPPVTGTSLAVVPDDEFPFSDSSNASADATDAPGNRVTAHEAVAVTSSLQNARKSKTRIAAKAAAANGSRPVVPARLALASVALATDAAPLAVQPAPAPATLEPVKVEPAAGSKPAAALTYLYLGSFKDTKWADTAVDQLRKLGFSAVSVRKGKLFLQSYHVEVGPYDNAAAIDAAVARLASLGFTAHPVK